jgi:TonB family protein
MRRAILLLLAFVLTAPPTAPAQESTTASTPLLVPGPGPSTFEAKDGTFLTKKGRGWVHTEDKYTDFELEVEFRALSDQAEAAIAMRVPTLNDPAPTVGYFVALPPPATNPDARRIVTTRVADKTTLSAPAAGAAEQTDAGTTPGSARGQWQRVVVRVDHDSVALSVNGRPLQIVEASGPQTGYLGLESGRGTIEFRLFRVTRLVTVPMCYAADWSAVPRDQIRNLPQAVPFRGQGVAGWQAPTVMRDVKPRYSADAMRSKVQGTVTVEAVVRPDGTVGEVCVVKRLHSELDLEAVKAAKAWKFSPAAKDGTPVPVLIMIELVFTLR